jgi:hypothetical protein
VIREWPEFLCDPGWPALVWVVVAFKAIPPSFVSGHEFGPRRPPHKRIAEKLAFQELLTSKERKKVPGLCQDCQDPFSLCFFFGRPRGTSVLCNPSSFAIRSTHAAGPYG